MQVSHSGMPIPSTTSKAMPTQPTREAQVRPPRPNRKLTPLPITIHPNFRVQATTHHHHITISQNASIESMKMVNWPPATDLTKKITMRPATKGLQKIWLQAQSRSRTICRDSKTPSWSIPWWKMTPTMYNGIPKFWQTSRPTCTGFDSTKGALIYWIIPICTLYPTLCLLHSLSILTLNCACYWIYSFSNYPIDYILFAEL